FLPAGRVGVAENDDGRWSPWVARFAGDAPEPADGAPPLTVARFVIRSAQLLVDLSTSLGRSGQPPVPEGIFLSASARRPGSAGQVRYPLGPCAESAEAARQAESAALVAAVAAVDLLGATARPIEPLSSVIVEHLDRLHREWADRIRRDQVARRLWQVAGLVLACARGAARDGPLNPPNAFSAIDHPHFRQWLARARAAPAALARP